MMGFSGQGKTAAIGEELNAVNQGECTRLFPHMIYLFDINPRQSLNIKVY